MSSNVSKLVERFFESFGDAGSKFATVERLMCSVGFYHAQVRTFDLLIGRVAVFAL
jgi:hypothetical protein